MSGQSLGLIETVGLAVALEAADAAMKSANVALTGYELTKGGGLVTVKLTGEVGAMNAAVAAGVAAAERIGRVYAWKVIARTAAGIESLINASENQGVAPEPSAEVASQAVEERQMAIDVVSVEPSEVMPACIEGAPQEPVDVPPADEKKTPPPRAKKPGKQR